MADSSEEKKLPLQQISIANRPEMGGLVLRLVINCDANLPSVDDFIGQLITWRDRLAKMKESDNG